MPNIFYHASKELTFGIAGTTGTDVTVVIDFLESKVAAINVSKKAATYFVANIYDTNNKNITQDVVDKAKFTWSWKDKKEETLLHANASKTGD
jgi:hypothetical protein